MRRPHPMLRSMLGFIVLLALAGGAVWLIAVSRPNQLPAPAETTALAASRSAQSPLPTPTPAPRAPSASPTPSASLLPYQLGEPRVALTHTAHIGIVGWLPDNRRLLLTMSRSKSLTETIETFDTVSGKREVYGERQVIDRPPVWLDGASRVAFTRSEGERVDLWVSGTGTELTREPLLREVNWALGSTGRSLVTVTYPNAELRELSDTGDRASSMSIDLRSLGLAVDHRLSGLRIVTSPVTAEAALFDAGGFFIVDLATGGARRIDLGEVASEGKGYGPYRAALARWSPDGRRMLLITTLDEPAYGFTDLIVLDVGSSTVTPVRVEERYVMDATWAPDSRHLALLATLRMDDDGASREGLYLADADTGMSQRALGGVDFNGWSEALRWSADGRYLAVHCPGAVRMGASKWEDGLCIISVEATGSKETEP